MTDRTSKERSYQAEKPCCSVCDRKKVCHVCKAQTLLACSDCRLNFGAVVYVCAQRACRDEHERMCFGDGSSPETEGYPGIAHDFEQMRLKLRDAHAELRRLDGTGGECRCRFCLPQKSEASREPLPIRKDAQ